MAPEPYHLAIAFDQNYITPFYVLVTSVFHSNPESRLHIHTIVSGVSDQEKEEMRCFVRQHHSEIFFYELTQQDIEGLVIPTHLYFTVAAYYRLFFPSLVPDTVQKLLYLDTDIVVVGDLKELYATDISNYPVGAVAEVNATKNRPDLGIHEVGVYFNSGVMLMNIPEWKKQRISEKAIQFVRDFPEKIVWVDQDALNVVLMNNYTKLNKKFNVIPFDIPRYLPKRAYHKFLSDKVIIHYTLKEHKPWNVKCVNKFRYLYHYHLKHSPRAAEKKYRGVRLTMNTITTVAKVRAFELLLNIPKAAAIISLLLGEEVMN